MFAGTNVVVLTDLQNTWQFSPTPVERKLAAIRRKKKSRRQSGPCANTAASELVDKGSHVKLQDTPDLWKRLNKIDLRILLILHLRQAKGLVGFPDSQELADLIDCSV